MSAAAATTGEGFPFCLDTDGFPTNCDAGGSGPLVVSFQRVDWDEVNQPIWRPFSEPIGGTCDQSFDGSNRYRRDANISLDAITHFEYGKGQLNNVTNLQQRQPIEKLDVECYPIPADSAFVALRFYGAASGGSSILEFAIHTSCSEQLECGDEFAFLRVCGGINANNQNVSC